MKEKKKGSKSSRRAKKFLRVAGGGGTQPFGTAGGKVQRSTARIQSAVANRFGTQSHVQAQISPVYRFKGQRRALAQKQVLAGSYARQGPAGYGQTLPGLLGPAPPETQTPPGPGLLGLIDQINSAQKGIRGTFTSPGGASVLDPGGKSILDSLMNVTKDE
jgi:hypothetical protein